MVVKIWIGPLRSMARCFLVAFDGKYLRTLLGWHSRSDRPRRNRINGAQRGLVLIVVINDTGLGTSTVGA